MGNVINLFERKQQKSAVAASTENSKPTLQGQSHSFSDFEEIIKRNLALQEKLKKERMQSNQKVLRNYKIKTE